MNSAERELFQEKLDEVKQLKNRIAELEAKIPKPKVWCCEFAKSSNGWNHNEKCPNWVLKF